MKRDSSKKRDRVDLRNLPELASVQEVASALNVSPRHIARLCERGEIKAVKLGAKLWRINRNALAERFGL